MNSDQHEQDLFVALVKLLASSTRDCVVTIQQFVQWIPDVVLSVQTMKDSGMTENEIVQKIMANVKENNQ